MGLNVFVAALGAQLDPALERTKELGDARSW